MESPVETPETHSQRGFAHPVAACLLVASIAGLTAAAINGRPSDPPGPSPVAKSPAVRVMPPVDRQAERVEFFEQEVLPLIDQADRQNQESADRCIKRLSGLIDQYRRGVDPFVDDLTSISTRLGIVRRMPAQWWKQDQRVEKYVQEKFEQHLFSERELIASVSEILDAFRDEVDANQRRMLTQVRASLDISDLPEVQIDDDEAFLASVANQLQTYSAQQGASSVQNGLTVLVVSEAGSYAAITVASGLMARFGTAAATTAVAAGGATAGASAAGAGSGTLAGPVGTAVGLGVGLVVGLTIDWWMTEKFEQELSQKMRAYLDRLEQSILEGPMQVDRTPDRSALESNVGIKQALPQLCNRLREAYQQRFHHQIVQLETKS